MGFVYEDYLFSETAESHLLDNTPSEAERTNITTILMPVVNLVYDLAESLWPGCMSVKIQGGSLHSGFRSLKVNAAVGGSPTSAHCDGLGADVFPMNGKTMELFAAIQKHPEIMEQIDQLIDERGCVHVGCSTGVPRNQIRGEQYVANLDGTKTRTYPLIRIWKEGDQ